MQPNLKQHTTPDSLTINYYLNKMVQSGVTHCFMEVSSKWNSSKNEQKDLYFVGGIFTLNLSHDHLDYHKFSQNIVDVKSL
jgi:UDP-N-acetylmuramoyl-L-alanyl-D-glutamate--2,6-diaminopimelate ligase